MLVRVLGSAARHGVPAWWCRCAGCAEVRAARARRRTRDALAVSADGERWLLLNAAPDVVRQCEGFDGLHPRADVPPPVAWLLVTDDRPEHLAGAAELVGHGVRALARASVATKLPEGLATETLDVGHERTLSIPSGSEEEPAIELGLSVLLLDHGVRVREAASGRVLVYAPALDGSAAWLEGQGDADVVFADAAALASLPSANGRKHRYLTRVSHDDALLAGARVDTRGWVLAADGLDLFV